MTDTQATPAPSPRLPQLFALRDLAVAPENMRFDEGPHDEIPLLADTILAAGLMQPLTVRPGRKREKPAMVLDGRRRLLVLSRLREQGAVDDDYPVTAFVETDVGRQAAAVVVTNTAAPVHVADVIAAIGKMLKARLEVAAIAAALGYGEVEVRRLEAVAGLSAEALAALKAGRMTLREAKLLARLPDAAAQGEIVAQLMQGYGFPEHRLSQAFERGQTTRADRRFVLVGEARYVAAGGRVECDLFGEFPDVLLDPGLLDGLWIDRAQRLAAQLGRPDLTVRATSEPDPDWPEDLEPYGYDADVRLDAAEAAALDAAEATTAAALEALAGRDPADGEADEVLVAELAARLAAEQALEPRRPVTHILLNPGRGRPIALQAFAPPAPTAGQEGGDLGADSGEAPVVGDGPRPPDAEAAASPAAGPPPGAEVEGASHALHEVRTDMATRALIRALADHPGVALTAVLAQLFSAVMLHERGAGALAICLDLTELRTTAVRPRARAEAAELAALCDTPVTAYWTPDEVFLRALSKPQLLAMLAAMGEPDGVAKTVKKDELVGLVTEAAARRRWPPAYLSWRMDAEEAGDPAADAAPEDGDRVGTDGDGPETSAGVAGAVNTADGEAPLAA